MNKKAQSVGLAIMGIIFVIIMGFAMINFLFNEVDLARAGLSCASPNSISDGSKLLCLIVDLTIPYWIWIVLSIGVGLILARLLG
jgi:hypothetical protein